MHVTLRHPTEIQFVYLQLAADGVVVQYDNAFQRTWSELG
jgi:hypothetical protein